MNEVNKIGLIGFLIILAIMVAVYMLYNADEQCDISDNIRIWSGSDGEPQIAINETYLAEMEAQRKLEMKIWLAPNSTGNYTITIPYDTNITVWRGDELVAHVPRSHV